MKENSFGFFALLGIGRNFEVFNICDDIIA